MGPDDRGDMLRADIPLGSSPSRRPPSASSLSATLISPPLHCYVHRLWAIRCSSGPHLDPAIVGFVRQSCAVHPDLHGRGRSPIPRGSLDPGSTLGGCPVE